MSFVSIQRVRIASIPFPTEVLAAGTQREACRVWFLIVAFLILIPRAFASSCPGAIKLDIADEPITNGQEDFYLTYHPAIPKDTQSASIHFGPTTFYDIADSNDRKVDGDLPLPPNVRTRFRLTVRQNNPGLIELVVMANWDSDCPHPDLPLNTGFSDIVAMESRTRGFVVVEGGTFVDPPPIQPGRKFIELDFVGRSNHRPLSFGVPPTLEITSTGDTSLLQKDGQTANSLRLTMDGSTIPIVQIENTHWGSSGMIEVNVRKGPTSSAIANYRIRYSTDFPWYVLFGMTFLGALLYVAIESLPSFNKAADGSAPPPYWKLLLKDDGSKIILAFIVAVVAFLLKDTTVLGAIKFDPTTLKGYAILGFFTNVFGLEAIFKKVKGLIES